PPEAGDGYRVLIDHVWPRGVSRERAKLDQWARELAPSDELRHWFDHVPERFDQFRTRYRKELEDHGERIEELRARACDGAVTSSGLQRSLRELVKLRASQINGCAYCLDMHSKDVRARGEDEQRLHVLAAWREAPFYSPRERAALACASR